MAEDKDALKRLILNHSVRLQRLKEQQIQGQENTSKTSLEIQTIEEKIRELQAKLDNDSIVEIQSITRSSISPYKVGGALSEKDVEVYIERTADSIALNHLQKMDYVLIIEPRQQGKTSLVNHLMYHPTSKDVIWIYIDTTTLDKSSEQAWYATLCSRILRQLDKFVSETGLDIPINGADWRDFLSKISQAATRSKGQIIIVLDEIGAIKFPGDTTFFSVLRDIYNSRQIEPHLKQLTFWLVGAFHPQDLIDDDKISPFNVAQQIRLRDFTSEQVHQLVSKGEWSFEQKIYLAERIYYWAEGQPYLTQLLCSYLGPEAAQTDVDVSIDRLRREDRNHLPPLLKRLDADDKLRPYVSKIQNGAKIKFFPGANPRHAQLELLGVLKADNDEGYCTIRNRIYERVLKDIEEH